MKRFLTSLALMSCLSVGTATSAHAAIFVDQAPDTSTDFGFLATSDFGAASQAQQGDKFLLTQGVEKINAVWYGGYFSDDFFFAKPPLTPDDFTVNFFGITGGVTDTSPTASFTGTDLTVTRTDTGIDLPPTPSQPDLPFEMFRYQATLDFTAIGAVLPPLKDYVFSVVNNSTGTPDTNWYWIGSLQGDGLAQNRTGPQGSTAAWLDYGLNNSNFAYTLSAPTPGTISIFLAGLCLLGSIRVGARRRNAI